jgi:hypothetical protein
MMILKRGHSTERRGSLPQRAASNVVPNISALARGSLRRLTRGSCWVTPHRHWCRAASRVRRRSNDLEAAVRSRCPRTEDAPRNRVSDTAAAHWHEPTRVQQHGRRAKLRCLIKQTIEDRRIPRVDVANPARGTCALLPRPRPGASGAHPRPPAVHRTLPIAAFRLPDGNWPIPLGPTTDASAAHRPRTHWQAAQ